MKNLLYFAVAAIASVSLAAQTTGGISGKITDSSGKPVPNVSVLIKRMDIKSERTLRVDSATGNFRQVGLNPVEWTLVVSAEGYVEHTEVVKIQLGGNVAVKDIILKTLAEQNKNTPAEGASELGRSLADSAIAAYNEAKGLFDNKNYHEAMAKSEDAIQNFTESLTTLTDEATREQVRKNIAIANKLFALCQYEIGNADANQRGDLWLKAEPLLKDSLEKSPDDAYVAQALADIAGFKGDTEAQNMYNDLVEKIQGPVAGNSYNRAVDLYNAGKTSEAKPYLKKAIEIDPKFSESYYLLGLCEIGDGDMAAGKINFQKYLELDPNGKYAKEVKEILADPFFK
jgi:tetratricopeptide (TPR) repeat protein